MPSSADNVMKCTYFLTGIFIRMINHKLLSCPFVVYLPTSDVELATWVQ